MRKIVIDIDDTLWDFISVFCRQVESAYPGVVLPTEWSALASWVENALPETLHGVRSVMNDIHREQDRFPPFPEARSFLASLKIKGFHITIASHRDSEALDATMRWLMQYNLIFDDLHLSKDKTVLFDDCLAVVDDSPDILRNAQKAGIIGVGLKTQWNEKENYLLFNELPEILQYLDEKLPREESAFDTGRSKDILKRFMEEKDPVRKSLKVAGIVVPGLGRSSSFLSLQWVNDQVVEQFSFSPYCGTLNIDTGDSTVQKQLKEQGKRRIIPAEKEFCEALVFDAIIKGGYRCGVILPLVPNYPGNILEIVSPVNLKQALAIDDGAKIEAEIYL